MYINYESIVFVVELVLLTAQFYTTCSHLYFYVYEIHNLITIKYKFKL